MKNDYLPVEAYTDPEWFALEQRHIFSATWAYVGLADDLTEPEIGRASCRERVWTVV